MDPRWESLKRNPSCTMHQVRAVSRCPSFNGKYIHSFQQKSRKHPISAHYRASFLETTLCKTESRSRVQISKILKILWGAESAIPGHLILYKTEVDSFPFHVSIPPRSLKCENVSLCKHIIQSQFWKQTLSLNPVTPYTWVWTWEIPRKS